MDEFQQIAADFLVFHPDNENVRVVKADQEDYFFLVAVEPGWSTSSPHTIHGYDVFVPAWREWVEAGRPTIVEYGAPRIPEHMERWLTVSEIIDGPSLRLLIQTALEVGVLSAVDILGCIGGA